MIPIRAITFAPVAVLGLLAAGCASTPDEPDPTQVKLTELDGRMQRVERTQANQVEMAQRLDEIQNNLRELRGRIDELEHNYDALSKQQRDLYADLDKRIGNGSGGAAATDAGSAAPPANSTSKGMTGTDTPAGASSTEQAVYGQAFDALRAGSYSTAITGFKDFLTTYPSSTLADNAQYWLGEAYYVTHDYDGAAGSFRTVLKKWPDSRKAPDALLKLGYTQFAQKQFPAARATLNEVVQKYPNTDDAKLATDRLKRIPAGGAQAQ
jgi:tol-pal system protein YbgF